MAEHQLKNKQKLSGEVIYDKSMYIKFKFKDLRVLMIKLQTSNENSLAVCSLINDKTKHKKIRP